MCHLNIYFTLLTGSRKGIRPVKNWVVGAGVDICLERGADLHMAQQMPLPLTVTHCLASVKSRLVLPFWYRLTWVVPDKGPLNGCVCDNDQKCLTEQSHQYFGKEVEDRIDSDIQSWDLHIAQLMPLPLTVSCFSKIQIGLTFLVPDHPGNPGQRAIKRVCVSLTISADLHMAQLMPLPHTVSCFSKIQISFTFLVPAHPDSPRQRTGKWMCVCADLSNCNAWRFDVPCLPI